MGNVLPSMDTLPEQDIVERQAQPPFEIIEDENLDRHAEQDIPRDVTFELDLLPLLDPSTLPVYRYEYACPVCQLRVVDLNEFIAHLEEEEEAGQNAGMGQRPGYIELPNNNYRDADITVQLLPRDRHHNVILTSNFMPLREYFYRFARMLDINQPLAVTNIANGVCENAVEPAPTMLPPPLTQEVSSHPSTSTPHLGLTPHSSLHDAEGAPSPLTLSPDLGERCDLRIATNIFEDPGDSDNEGSEGKSDDLTRVGMEMGGAPPSSPIIPGFPFMRLEMDVEEGGSSDDNRLTENAMESGIMTLTEPQQQTEYSIPAVAVPPKSTGQDILEPSPINSEERHPCRGQDKAKSGSFTLNCKLIVGPMAKKGTVVDLREQFDPNPFKPQHKENISKSCTTEKQKQKDFEFENASDLGCGNDSTSTSTTIDRHVSSQVESGSDSASPLRPLFPADSNPETLPPTPPAPQTVEIHEEVAPPAEILSPQSSLQSIQAGEDKGEVTHTYTGRPYKYISKHCGRGFALKPCYKFHRSLNTGGRGHSFRSSKRGKGFHALSFATRHFLSHGKQKPSVSPTPNSMENTELMPRLVLAGEDLNPANLVQEGQVLPMESVTSPQNSIEAVITPTEETESLELEEEELIESSPPPPPPPDSPPNLRVSPTPNSMDNTELMPRLVLAGDDLNPANQVQEGQVLPMEPVTSPQSSIEAVTTPTEETESLELEDIESSPPPAPDSPPIVPVPKRRGANTAKRVGKKQNQAIIVDPARFTILGASGYECQACKSRFKTKKHIRYHTIKCYSTEEGRLYKCEEEGCGKSFVDKSNYNRHLRTHKQRRYNCSVSEFEKAFSHPMEPVTSPQSSIEAVTTPTEETESLELEDIESLSPPPPDSPPITVPVPKRRGAKTAERVGKKQYQAIIVDPARFTILGASGYECQACKSRFKTKKQIRYHTIKCYSTDEGRLYKCEEEGCGKSFVAKSNYNRHLRTHKQERPFVCPHQGCALRFARHEGLHNHNHVWSHTGELPVLWDYPDLNERPFLCETCGKEFGLKGELYQHQRHHSTERRFVCNLDGCSEGFILKKYLIRHQAVHLEAGARPFMCEICGSGFRLQEALDRHQKWHSTERPFVCDLDGCSEGFILKKYLIRHQAGHSGTRPFKCSICHNAEYSRKDNLMRHVLLKHSLPASDAKGSA